MPLKVSYHPAKFGGHIHCGSKDVMVLVCHVISEDHEDHGWWYLTIRHHPHRFDGHRHCGSGDIMVFLVKI